MVYAFTQDVPIGPELYQRILDEIGPEPLAGSLVHLCVRLPEGGLRYIDVWESEQACARAFDGPDPPGGGSGVRRRPPAWRTRGASPRRHRHPR